MHRNNNNNNRNPRNYQEDNEYFEQRRGGYGRGGRDHFNDRDQDYRHDGNRPMGQRGRGRGQRAGNSRGRPRVNVNVPPPAQPLAQAPPAPAHLSKVESQEKNDPLYKDAVFPDASQDLRPRADQLNYYPGCEGMTEIINQCHESLVASSPGFAKRVPLNLFAYYCASAVYARLLWLNMSNGYHTEYEEREFTEKMRELNLPLPTPLLVYMQGFGNTTMPSGRKVLFKMLNRDLSDVAGLSGWFGRLTAETHFLYRVYPCLPVYALNILNSILYTQGDNDALNWDVPDLIRPVGAPADERPTINMLGYTRATRYSAEQLRFLADCRFQADEFPPNDQLDFVFFSNVLVRVADELRETRNIKLGHQADVITGSQGQNIINFPICTFPTLAADAPLVARCLSQINSNVAYLGAAMKYRLKHNPCRHDDQDVLPSTVYYRDQDAPAAWILSRNTPRDLEPPLYNEYNFESTDFLPRPRIAKLCEVERVAQ